MGPAIDVKLKVFNFLQHDSCTKRGEGGTDAPGNGTARGGVGLESWRGGGVGWQ